MMIGLIFDVLIIFLMTISPETVRSMASYIGVANFAGGSMIVLLFSRKLNIPYNAAKEKQSSGLPELLKNMSFYSLFIQY